MQPRNGSFRGNSSGNRSGNKSRQCCHVGRLIGAPSAEEVDVSNETTATVVGNLTADPDLRQTSAGVPVATFTVASTSRVKDSSSGEWRDGETLFLRCSAWRRSAESVARSLGKGDRVVVTGRLRQSTFETDEGRRRSMIELIADEVALSLLSKGFQPVRTGSGDTEERAGSVAPEAGRTYAR